MTPFRRTVLAAVLGLIAAVPARADTVLVEASAFLIYLNDATGLRQSVTSRIVPLIPNRVCYGWRIRLAGPPQLVSFREVFTLPRSPDLWGGEDNAYATSAISKDRTRAVTERFATTVDGWIGHSWCIAPGDPEGPHVMEVFINDALAERFEFEVRDFAKR